MKLFQSFASTYFFLASSGIYSVGEDITLNIFRQLPIDKYFLAISRIAAGRESMQSLKKLIDCYGINVDIVNKYQQTALHVAADRGNYEMVLGLLRLGASFQPRDLNGRTPLDYATKKGHAKVFRLLDATYRFFIAVNCGYCDGVFSLVAKEGVYINTFAASGETALHIATKRRDMSMMVVLLLLGADPRLCDRNNQTPAFYATKEMVILMKVYGLV